MTVIVETIGGPLEAYTPTRAAADGTVRVKKRDGTVVVAAGVAAREAVDTTLSVGVAEGAESLTLAAAFTGAVGRRYLISGGGGHSEEIVVERYSGTVVYPEQPLRWPHAPGSDFESCRLTYTVLAADVAAGTADDAWRAEWSWGAGLAPVTTVFAVAKVGRVHFNPLSPARLFQFDPTLPRKFALADWDGLVERAWTEVQARVSARGLPVYDYLDATGLEAAVAYVARLLASEAYGPGDAERAYLDERADRQIDLYCATSPVDEDRSDSIAEDEEKGRTGSRTTTRRP